MPGLTGREVMSAFARSATWSTPASVTRQVLLLTDEGLEDHPQLITDESFGQQFIGAGQVGDRDPITPELQCQLRYEQLDTWLAAACGSAANPTVISSVAANSLVAYSHSITLAAELTHFFTLAIDTTQYVKEVRTFKLRGFTIRVGDGGRLLVNFPIVGDRVSYDSTVNTNSTIYGATQAVIGYRVLRKDGRVRMNLTDAGALGASDCNSLVMDFEIMNTRPLAQDHVVGSDVITEADDDGFGEFSVRVTFARMNTVSANSLAQAFGLGSTFKMDWFFQGDYINSTTRRSLLMEMPAAQVVDFKTPITGANQVKPQVDFRLYRVLTAPSGMSGVTNPLRLTLVNANSANLLA